MEENICIKCVISGRVQGVWFRAATQEQANQLGITGWARNLPDGNVEVVACGEKSLIAKLYEWLKVGPRLAKVTEVSYVEIPLEQHERFAIK